MLFSKTFFHVINYLLRVKNFPAYIIPNCASKQLESKTCSLAFDNVSTLFRCSEIDGRRHGFNEDTVPTNANPCQQAD